MAKPRYVSRIDAAKNTLTVGGSEQLERSSCQVEDVRYVAAQPPTEAFRATVKVRSHASLAQATITPLNDRAGVAFDSAQRALAPGQAAVFYDGDRVIGGGPIAISDD